MAPRKQPRNLPSVISGLIMVAGGLAAASTTVQAGTTLTVVIETDRVQYAPGDNVETSARVTTDDGLPLVQVWRSSIRIVGPAGTTVSSGSMLPDPDGLFQYRYALASDAAEGRYQVVAAFEGPGRSKGIGRTEFRVTAPPPCPDSDLDGFTDAACGGDDCDDSDPSVHPGATEICGDGIDQDCNGSDLQCGGSPHAGLSWNGPSTCVTCHSGEAHEVHASVHYQWQGDTPFMVNGQSPQGKLTNAVNSYCVNILGNWNACGACHTGRGLVPTLEATPEQLENVDCMLCHQQEYKRKKVNGVFVPDTALMAITMDDAVQTVHRPVRANCLQCHATAGGGDAVKRGDITLAHAATSDLQFDVHMANTGADLSCQSCHTFTNHRVAGKGSDLRVTDSPVQLECANCHADMAAGGHPTDLLDRHTARVACQTCHIPVYAKDAADTAATEATETHRTWLDTHATLPPFHPASLKANDLTPTYRFWNRYSDNYLLGDSATLDPVTGRYPTSRPVGDVADTESKLYPFKYKTAEQPIATSTSQLIALDTSVFFATADPAAATEQGLVNMGMSAHEPYAWVETDTFQLLSHEVSPHDQALQCADCHGSTQRMDLRGELGYALKGPTQTVCTQCHGPKEMKPFQTLHDKHVRSKRYDCSWCHEFSRPERNLTMPPT